MHTPSSLTDIAAFLDAALDADAFADDQRGVFVPSARAVQRIGLALEPWPGLRAWAEHAQLDAVFLHRPWKLEPAQLPEGVGVLAYHLAFDERLTLGWNPRLAAALGMANRAVLGRKQGRPLGMLCAVHAAPFDTWQRRLAAEFGGSEEAQPCDAESIDHIAVVGAMNDALVREAAQRGAQLYVTGQFQQPAAQAVADTGIGVVAVGHRRSEAWGLRALAGMLHERWTGLNVSVHADTMT